MRALLATAFLVTTTLAGCSSGPDAQPSTTGATVTVTKPGDFSGDAHATRANAPHLHDYWMGQERILRRLADRAGPWHLWGE